MFSDPNETDGRAARRSRNREAAVDAMVDLFNEGQLTPNAVAVAQRSGVSLRSVYRYFEDMDSLRRAAIARSASRMEPLFELERPAEGPLLGRAQRFVEGRVRLHDAGAPTMRAAIRVSAENELVRRQLAVARRRLLDQGKAMFSPELSELDPAERGLRAVVIDLISGFEALERLRVDCGYPASTVVQILTDSLVRILDPIGARP